MKHRLILIALLLVSGVYAQDARSLLDKVSAKYSNNISYYIKFNYELRNDKTNTRQKESGEVYAAKQKYRLKLMGITQIYNGKNLYTIDDQAKEVNISKPDKNSSDLLTPTKVLGIYKNGYHLSYDNSKTVGGRKVQYVKLTPKGKSDVKYYKIGVFTDKNELYQYQEVNNTNTETTLTVSKYLENLIISKANFRFNKNTYKSKGFFITEL